MKRPTMDRKGTKLQKERKKRSAYDGAYKEELVAMIGAKKVLARWNELKMLEDEKWRSKLVARERKLKVEECRLTLEDERLRDARKVKDRASMTKTEVSLRNGGGGGREGGRREDGGDGGHVGNMP